MKAIANHNDVGQNSNKSNQVFQPLFMAKLSKFSARHRRLLKDDSSELRLIRVILSGLNSFGRKALRIHRSRASHLKGFAVVAVSASVVLVIIEVIGLILRRSLGRGVR